MAERLLVRFNDHEGLEWLCIDGPRSDSQAGALTDFIQVAKDKAIVLLLPASAVLLLEIELPLIGNARIKKALPYAVEDLLAEEVEKYHLAWLGLPRGKVAVAAVEHEKLAACIASFRREGLELAAIYPESLCLPHRSDGISVLMDKDQAIVRWGPLQGGGVDTSFLGPLLGKASEGATETTRLHVWGERIPVELPFECVLEPFSTPLELFAEGLRDGAALNLLNGPYAPQHGETSRLRAWLPVFAVMLVAAAIQYGGLLNQNRQQRNALAELETQTLESFRQSFPDVKRIVNVKAQADQQLAELRKGGARTGSAFMRMLFQSGEFLKDNPDIRLKKLNFINNGLQMQLNAADIGRLDRFEQALQSHFQVRIQSAENGESGVEAQIEIREQ